MRTLVEMLYMLMLAILVSSPGVSCETLVANLLPSNCQHALKRLYHPGLVIINIGHGAGGYPVYCDQHGWMVIQRRFDGSVLFNKTWDEYRDGFGDISGEYWFGLSKVHAMTRSGTYKLRVELSDFYGDSAYAEYDNFSISGADDNFSLSVGRYTGTAGDSLNHVGRSGRPQNGSQFSTVDRDNDGLPSNCAMQYRGGGGWWHSTCGSAGLNGIYHSHATFKEQGLVWWTWRRGQTLRSTALKIKPTKIVA